MNKIKTLLIVAALALASFNSTAAVPPGKRALEVKPAVKEVAAVQDDAYAAGKFSVAPFAVARIVDSQEDLGGGLAASYSFTRNLSIEAEATSYHVDDSNWADTVADVGAGLKLALPIKDTGFAPYAIGGYKRDLLIHENRIVAGAGFEWRSGPFGLFIDGRVNHGFEQELSELGNDVEIRFGGRVSF